MNDTSKQPDPDSPSDPHENLVAYLDGELSEADVRHMEQQLAQNPALRRDIEAFQKAWELLDELPQVRATEQFTTKTIASLKIEALPHLSPTKSSPPQNAAVRTATPPSAGTAKPLAIAVWFAGLAISATVGFTITNRVIPSPAERLLQNLPVIEQWDKFQDVGSLEFLKQYRELKKGGETHEPPP